MPVPYNYKDKKRIIWITTQFPNGEKNKQGMFIYRSVKELSKYYPITVICLYTVFPPIFLMIKKLHDIRKIYNSWNDKYPRILIKPNGLRNVEVIYVKYFRPPRGRFEFLEGYFALKAIERSSRRLSESKHVLVHANWIFPEGKVAELLFNKYKLQYVLTVRGNDVNSLEINSLKWRAAKSIFKNASKITSVSEVLLEKCINKNLIVKEDKNKQILTHNFYDINKFIIKDKITSRKNIGINTDEKIIFYAGNLISGKNVGILIESVYQIIKEGYNIKLFIAGNGEEEDELKRQVTMKNLSQYIFFIGELASDNMVEYYNSADLFCLVSKNEGLPNVIIESLLCGTPVIGSSVGELPKIIQEEVNGYLVTPNSVISLSEKIKKGLSKNWSRQLLRESIKFLFPENVIKEYKKLYNEFNIPFNKDK